MPEQFTSSTEGRIYREWGTSSPLWWTVFFVYQPGGTHPLSRRRRSGAHPDRCRPGGAGAPCAGTTAGQRPVLLPPPPVRCLLPDGSQTIDELKSAGVSGTQLYDLAQSCGPEQAKLSELALIYQGYETLLPNGMDPSDRLELAAGRLEAAQARGTMPGFCRGRAVLLTSSTPSMRPKSVCWGRCWHPVRR